MTERMRAEGRPWFIALELSNDEEQGYRDIEHLDMFCVIIREKAS